MADGPEVRFYSRQQLLGENPDLVRSLEKLAGQIQASERLGELLPRSETLVGTQPVPETKRSPILEPIFSLLSQVGFGS